MKKFEILNNKWIRQIIFIEDHSVVISHYCALKIDAIIYLDTKVYKTDGNTMRYIALRGHTTHSDICLWYEDDEAIEYKEDLAFFEKLLLS